MNAITCCVGYDDYIEVTLPGMQEHFDRVVVVTTPDDKRTISIAENHGVDVITTRMFTWNGSTFNRGAALEWALSLVGWDGWIALIDADISLPSAADFSGMELGTLYGARRRVVTEDETQHRLLEYLIGRSWKLLPTEHDRYEWNGSTVAFGGHLLIFHTEDPVLAPRPWYPIHWKHTGGSDSDFITKWAPENQKRLPFDVLHLGSVKKNWHGRATPRLDGKPVPGAAAARAAMKAMDEARKTGGYAEEML